MDEVVVIIFDFVDRVLTIWKRIEVEKVAVYWMVRYWDVPFVVLRQHFWACYAVVKLVEALRVLKDIRPFTVYELLEKSWDSSKRSFEIA